MKVKKADFVAINSDLKSKYGVQNFTLSTGQSYPYVISFVQPFTDANFVIVIESNTSSVRWHITNKTASGFTINAIANEAVSGGTFTWHALRFLHD